MTPPHTRSIGSIQLEHERNVRVQQTARTISGWGRFVRRELLGSFLIGVVVSVATVTVPVAVTRSLSEAAIFLPWAVAAGGCIGLSVGAGATLFSWAGWRLSRDLPLRGRAAVIGICGAISAAPLIFLAGFLALPSVAVAGAIVLCALVAGGASAVNAYLALRGEASAHSRQGVQSREQ